MGAIMIRKRPLVQCAGSFVRLYEDTTLFNYKLGAVLKPDVDLETIYMLCDRLGGYYDSFMHGIVLLDISDKGVEL